MSENLIINKKFISQVRRSNGLYLRLLFFVLILPVSLAICFGFDKLSILTVLTIATIVLVIYALIFHNQNKYYLLRVSEEKGGLSIEYCVNNKRYYISVPKNEIEVIIPYYRKHYRGQFFRLKLLNKDKPVLDQGVWGDWNKNDINTFFNKMKLIKGVKCTKSLP